MAGKPIMVPKAIGPSLDDALTWTLEKTSLYGMVNKGFAAFPTMQCGVKIESERKW